MAVAPVEIRTLVIRAQQCALFIYQKTKVRRGAAMLSAKQQAWIDYYKQGRTATEAARLAGYKAKSDKAFQNIGSENLGKLGQYIADRDAVLESPRIADMQEINEFWTSMMRDTRVEAKDRIKASELRAKAAGAFVDRMQLSGRLDTGKLESVLEQLRGGSGA